MEGRRTPQEIEMDEKKWQEKPPFCLYGPKYNGPPLKFAEVAKKILEFIKSTNRPDVAEWEYWTEEYINKFCQFLVGELALDSDKKPKVILELGAGSGMLSLFLTKKLSKYVDAGTLSFVTTDGYPAEQVANKTTVINDVVVRKDAQSILSDLSKNGTEPDLVLMSWPPYESNWAKIIRETTKISRYVIIGDLTMVGECGKTITSLDPDWSVRELKELKKWQIGASDEFNIDYQINRAEVNDGDLSKAIFESRHSSTFYFTKKIG
ncbi:MAG: hypothetical protein KBC69_04225 [Candidatus Magasanikbacteria bacterium]|nr:hypothetical protein [Candidatus Magasanikbacteria bacterium]